MADQTPAPAGAAGERRPAAAPLPDGGSNGRTHRLTDPPRESLDAALAKAQEGDYYRRASWQPDLRCYLLPSRTDPRADPYRVSWLPRPAAWVSRIAAEGRWWLLLDCTCPAQQSNKYAVCVHKAAVWWLSRHPRRPTVAGSGAAKSERPAALDDLACQQQHAVEAWHVHSWFCRACGVVRSPVYPLAGPPPPAVSTLAAALLPLVSALADWRDRDAANAAYATGALAAVNAAVDALSATQREWTVDPANRVQLPSGYHLDPDTGRVVQEVWVPLPPADGDPTPRLVNSWTGEVMTVAALDAARAPQGVGDG